MQTVEGVIKTRCMHALSGLQWYQMFHELALMVIALSLDVKSCSLGLLPPLTFYDGQGESKLTLTFQIMSDPYLVNLNDITFVADKRDIVRMFMVMKPIDLD